MRELKLCGKLLEADERNFHCWNYRRYAAKMASTTLKDELDFTTKKIEQNFSNYSAWHQRSALIPLIYNNKNDLKKVLNQEFELIQNAMYTEPADQSVWFYHQWLIQKFMESSTVEETNVVLERELKMCNDLQAILEKDPVKDKERVEPRKWPLLNSVFLMKKQSGCQREILTNLKLLCQIDPLRCLYYRALAQSELKEIALSSEVNELRSYFL